MTRSSKVGTFASAPARETYLRAYDSMEALWPMAAEKIDVETSFGTTRVLRSGNDRRTPLILFHGLNGSGLSWHFAIEDLARDREVLAVDILGTAGRSIQTRPYATEADVGAWFDELMSGLELDEAHLLGESHGAWIAAIVAMHARRSPASLTLIEPNGFIVRPRTTALLRFAALSARPTESGWRRLSEWLTPGVSLTDEEKAVARAAMRYRPGLGWARVLHADELARITAPTLAVFGGESVLSRPEAATSRLRGMLREVTTVTVPGGGHAVHAQLPELVRPVVLDFLAAHDRTATGSR
ncbi:alpha/beta fold hydrolase [Agromyces sp. CFH 90414]|uniref:Alpha/beta fold hydrolase n=1 Tax=Agromyces agglutinans TaxID=2662258 RepID=A0A6I2FGT9_9MICO|nr:alpha/beta fold hydrolase [Agromyces agglutinans]MRG60118.1 alpha/beta fold hydrolase [Agromyces agglutinans]